MFDYAAPGFRVTLGCSVLEPGAVLVRHKRLKALEHLNTYQEVKTQLNETSGKKEKRVAGDEIKDYN